MLLCPRCGREVAAEEVVCECGADVTLLQQIIARADHCFNQAVTAHQTGRDAGALGHLEVNALLAPYDAEARLFQAKLLVRYERWQEAAAVVDLIRASRPEHVDVESDALADLLTEVGRETGNDA